MKILIAGKGFIGSNLGQKLEDEGHEVKYLSRSNADYNYDITEEFEIDGEFDVLYHTIGLAPGFNSKKAYETVHVEGTKNLLDAVNADKTVYISALGVGESDHSFFTTKEKAEEMVEQQENYTIVRPSTVIGEGNKLPELMKKTAPLRLFPDLKTRTQPILIEDLVEVLVKCADGLDGETVDAAGPEIYTIGEMAQKLYRQEGCSCYLIPFPTGLVEQLFNLSFLPPPLHAENRKLLRMENTTKENDAEDLVELRMPF